MSEQGDAASICMTSEVAYFYEHYRQADTKLIHTMEIAETLRILVADRIGSDAGLLLAVLGGYCAMVMAGGESPSIRRLRD